LSALRRTYEMIRSRAFLAPGARALSFFLTAAEYAQRENLTYGDHFARITQSGNFSHRLGATKDTRDRVRPSAPA
jgi:fatty-acyl-CoA synthase